MMHLWGDRTGEDTTRDGWQVKRQVFQRRRNASNRIFPPPLQHVRPAAASGSRKNYSRRVVPWFVEAWRGWRPHFPSLVAFSFSFPSLGCRGAAETTSRAGIHLALLGQSRIGRSALGWMDTSVRRIRRKSEMLTRLSDLSSCLLMIVVTEPDDPVPACLSSFTIYSLQFYKSSRFEVVLS